MIDIKEIKEIIDDSLLRDAEVSLYLFGKEKNKENPVTLYSLTIDNSVVDEIREISENYINEVLDFAEQNDIEEIPVYKPGMSRDIFKIYSREVDTFEGIWAFISGKQTIVPYGRDTLKKKRIKAWIFRFNFVKKNEVKDLLFFQRFQPNKALGKKSVIMKLEKEGQFKLIKDDVLILNTDLDFLCYQDTFVVMNKFSFEKVFEYEEMYSRYACDFINDLHAGRIVGLPMTIQFANKDVLSDLNSKINTNVHLAHKLYSARENEYYFKIDCKRLNELNLKHRFGLKLDLSLRVPQWTVDKETNYQVMANVLNDDYELSQITPYEYEVSNKEKMT